jgi:hypothetical protein
MVVDDFDLDGDPDLFVGNGHIQQDIAYIRDNTSYRQLPHLFVNTGDGIFGDRAEEAGFSESLIARGVASFDYDRDGDVDLIVTQNGHGVKVFRNETPTDAGYVQIGFKSDPASALPFGVAVELHQPDVVQRRTVAAGSSYLSTVEPVITFGLGGAGVDSVVVNWPSGFRTSSADVMFNQRYLVGRSGVEIDAR